MTANWLGLRTDWTWHSVRELQDEGVLLVEDGNHGEYRPRPTEFADNGTAFIRAADLSDGQVVFSGAGRINDVALRRIRKGIGRPGDLLFSHKGTVGKLAVAAKDAPPFVCSPQTTFWRVTDRERLDPKFLFVYMRAPEFQRQWTVRKGDTDMADYVSLTAQRTLLVPLPPLATQQAIAAIISAYDDLIENNNRRIKLLEEIARRVYTEWFVDFRYPGHEGVPLVDSELGPIPEGWSVRRMDDIAEVIDCLHSKKPESTEAGTGILLQLSNIGSGGMIDLTQTYRISAGDYALWTSRVELRGGDCVVTNVGRVAAVAQIPPGLKAAPGRNMTAIRPRGIPPTYLLQYLLSEHMAREVRRKQDAGSIMDSLNVKGIVKLAVPISPGALMTRFERLVRPIRREVELLMTEQQNLRTTRELLLPRLISGKIDVTNVRIASSVPAA